MKERRKRNCLPISISCPMDLLDTIDDVAYTEGKSRSEKIIEVLKTAFNKETKEK